MSQSSGWLEISTDGFASFNHSRPPGHLVKELVQNSLDAIGELAGSVALTYSFNGQDVLISCRDNGNGMDDLAAIRVVYLTFKKDSHLKRGRFGRGFKEILSVCRSASVISGSNQLCFLTEGGKQITRRETVVPPISGTDVSMTLPWGPETVPEFDTYFASFLVPKQICLTLNGRVVPHRAASHVIEATLNTEVYHADSHSWRKPRRKTSIELVPIHTNEEPTLYELGIPVAPAEWTVPFHANILQRVPMNPNRDALASGYAKTVHAACLPVLLDQLSPEQLTADWVGTAGTSCDEQIQKSLVEKAFGRNAVRAVPTMGKRDFNNDAERAGANIVKVAQMSGGFREMAKAHLPSAKDHVVEVEEKLRTEVASWRFDPDQAEGERRSWIDKRGGTRAVQRRLDFAVWFCQQLIDHGGSPQPRVTGAVAIGYRPQLMTVEITTFSAHWSDTNVLTLALDCDCFWENPLGAEALGILVHEAAHARNMHHGKSFNDEVERLAGVASEIMFEKGSEIRNQWPDLVSRNGSTQVAGIAPKVGWLRRVWG